MKITIICDVLGAPNNGTSIAAYNLIDYLTGTLGYSSARAAHAEEYYNYGSASVFYYEALEYVAYLGGSWTDTIELYNLLIAKGFSPSDAEAAIYNSGLSDYDLQFYAAYRLSEVLLSADPGMMKVDMISALTTQGYSYEIAEAIALKMGLPGELPKG